MASPVVAGTAVTGDTVGGTSRTINLPASIAAGDLLLVFVAVASQISGSETATITGWTTITGLYIKDAGNVQSLLGLYRWADGTEGTTATLATSGSTKVSVLAYRITGAVNPATQVPQAGTGVTGSGAANAADPPSVSVTGGSKDVLAIAVMGQQGETFTGGGAPTNYTNLITTDTGLAGPTTVNCWIQGAQRQVTTATENPGVFNHTSTDVWVVNTVIIHPAGSAAQSIAVGVASEAETAKTVSAAAGAVTITVTKANETETAKAIAANTTISVAVGAATETETAKTVTVVAGAVTIAVGAASETETAKVVTADTTTPQTINVGTATETETAQTVTVQAIASIAVGAAVETETASAVTPQTTITVSVTTASESETAQAVTVTAGAVTISVGTATETETAYVVEPVFEGGPQTISVAVAIELEIAKTVTATPGAVTITVTAAAETETAQGVIAVPGAVLVAVGAASETETAGTVTASQGAVTHFRWGTGRPVGRWASASPRTRSATSRPRQ